LLPLLSTACGPILRSLHDWNALLEAACAEFFADWQPNINCKLTQDAYRVKAKSMEPAWLLDNTTARDQSDESSQYAVAAGFSLRVAGASPRYDLRRLKPAATSNYANQNQQTAL
jgi:hypothetical protein